MTNLEWSNLAGLFYAFKVEADRFGFYTPETNEMEKSLELMRPFHNTPDVDEKVKTLKNREESPKVEAAGTKTPLFDEEDNLIKA